jgi:HD-GYP domain-containing protein (c-di-GMP phosphodiesterase class II)
VLRELGVQAVLMLPVSVAGRTWGLVEIYDAAPRRFSPSDARLAEFLVGHAEKMLEQFENGESVQRLYWETLASITNALESKDVSTSHHTQDVGELALEIGLQFGLDEEQLRAVQLGAVLHDVGKIHVPEAVLKKAGPLTREEWRIMRRHPEEGERILQPITPLREVLPIVRGHHERWDGAGYPDGTAGGEIPLGARIVAVCDAFRAMVEPRPYRRPLSLEQALQELQRHAGQQFDPRCVEALVAVLAENEPVDRPLHRPGHVLRAS